MPIDKIMTINSTVPSLGKSYQKADQAATDSTATTSTDKPAFKAVQKDSVTLSSAGSMEISNSQPDLTNEFSLVAKSIKETTATLGIAAGHVGGMKAALESIVKNFPPFPHDSLERAQILRSYSSIRKEIERMTIPPSFSNMLQAVDELSDQASDEQIAAALEKVESVQTQVTQAQAKLSGASGETY